MLAFILLLIMDHMKRENILQQLINFNSNMPFQKIVIPPGNTVNSKLIYSQTYATYTNTY